MAQEILVVGEKEGLVDLTWLVETARLQAGSEHNGFSF